MCCTVCTPFYGLQRFTASRSMGKVYKAIRVVDEGRLLPLEVTVPEKKKSGEKVESREIVVT